MKCKNPIQMFYLSPEFSMDTDVKEFVKEDELVTFLDNSRILFRKSDANAMAESQDNLKGVFQTDLEDLIKNFSEESKNEYRVENNHSMIDAFLKERFVTTTTAAYRNRCYMQLKKKYGFKVKHNVVRCRGCESCLFIRAKELGIRMMHELQSSTKNCWLTLTYNDEHCDVEQKDLEVYKRLIKTIRDTKELLKDQTKSKEEKDELRAILEEAREKKNGMRCPNILDYDHIQIFLKMLRRHIADTTGEKIRFSVVGEYGDKKGRMHWHMFIYGWTPDDLKDTRRRRSSKDREVTGQKYCQESPTISRYWKKGFVNVDVGLSAASAFYTSNYCLKKLKPSDGKKSDREPIFRHSLGLGREWVFTHLKEIISNQLVKYQVPVKENGNLSYKKATAPVPEAYIAMLKRALDQRKDYLGVSEQRKLRRALCYAVASREKWLEFFYNRNKIGEENTADFDWKQVVEASRFWLRRLYNDVNRRPYESQN